MIAIAISISYLRTIWFEILLNLGVIMTRLVTVFGGSGFVGKQVVRSLAKAGWRIRVAVRHLDEAYDLKPLGDVGQIQIKRCDVKRKADIEAALSGAQAIVNLVGIKHQNFGANFNDLHVQANAHMAEAAVRLGIKQFVMISALGADTKSSSAYQKTKALAEDAVRKLVPQAVILRPSLIFGPQDGFFTGVASQMQIFPFMPLIGGGKTKFAPVYVGDVAKAVVKVLSENEFDGKIFDLVGAKAYSFKELLQFVKTQTQASAPLIYMPFFVARLIALVGDLQSYLTPVSPILTNDELTRLKTDNVTLKGSKGLKDLGIAPTAMEAVVASYLWRFRKDGQFAQLA